MTPAQILEPLATSDTRRVLVELAERIAHAAGVIDAADFDELNRRVAEALGEARKLADEIHAETSDTFLRQTSRYEAPAWEHLSDAWVNAVEGLRVLNGHDEGVSL